MEGDIWDKIEKTRLKDREARRRWRENNRELLRKKIKEYNEKYRPLRACRVCQKEFIARSVTEIYCSATCGLKAHLRRERNRRNKHGERHE